MITYGVEGLSTVAILQIYALLKLVIANLAHIIVAVRLVAMNLFKLTAEVVRIGNLLLVWINHLQQAVVAVVCPLRHIGCTGVSLAKIHKWSRLHFLI